jgi:hypothetical protein
VVFPAIDPFGVLGLVQVNILIYSGGLRIEELGALVLRPAALGLRISPAVHLARVQLHVVLAMERQIARAMPLMSLTVARTTREVVMMVAAPSLSIVIPLNYGNLRFRGRRCLYVRIRRVHSDRGTELRYSRTRKGGAGHGQHRHS